LLWPSLFVLAALALDFLQYLAGSVIWRSQYRELEKRNLADGVDREEYDFGGHQTWKEGIITSLFVFKTVAAALGWGGLLVAVARRLLTDGVLG